MDEPLKKTKKDPLGVDALVNEYFQWVDLNKPEVEVAKDHLAKMFTDYILKCLFL